MLSGSQAFDSVQQTAAAGNKAAVEPFGVEEEKGNETARATFDNAAGSTFAVAPHHLRATTSRYPRSSISTWRQATQRGNALRAVSRLAHHRRQGPSNPAVGWPDRTQSGIGYLHPSACAQCKPPVRASHSRV